MTAARVYPPGRLMPGGPLPARSGDLENKHTRTASAPLRAVPVGVAATPAQDGALAPGTVSLPPGLETYAASLAEHAHAMREVRTHVMCMLRETRGVGLQARGQRDRTGSESTILRRRPSGKPDLCAKSVRHESNSRRVNL